VKATPTRRTTRLAAGALLALAMGNAAQSQSQSQSQPQPPAPTQSQLQVQLRREVQADLPTQAPVYDQAPTPSAPRALSIAAPIEQRLPNGLRVVLAARPGVQVVSAQLIVLSGTEADPARGSGLASMTAAMLTKGTTRHGASALVRAAESLGGALDSGAGWHQSSVGITVTVAKLDAALALVSETVRHPVFAPAELERLRAQALDDLRVGYSQPGTLASLASRHLLFGNGANGHPADGTPASLRRLRRADMVRLHAAQFRPDNAVLLLAGDVDADAALALASRHFGSWRAAPNASAPQPVADAALPQTAAIIDMPRSGQAAVVLAIPLPPAGADRATASVMNNVLGTGYSSRLNLEIRVKRGLSYGASSSLDARPQGGSLRVAVQTKNESAAEVLALIQAELDRLVATPVGDAELAARKATLIGNFSRSVETTAGLAGAIKSLIVVGLPPDELRRRIDEIGAVSAADVQRYAAAHLGAAARRVVVAGVAAQFGAALTAALPGVVTVPAQALDLERADGLMAR
jgi:zinc protease